MLTDDIEHEEAMIDLYHEILKRIDNGINDVVSYASVSFLTTTINFPAYLFGFTHILNIYRNTRNTLHYGMKTGKRY